MTSHQNINFIEIQRLKRIRTQATCQKDHRLATFMRERLTSQKNVSLLH